MRLSMFYSTLLLTGVNLLLRLVATSFQVYISGRIGATGVGLLQLVLSVAMLAETAGIAGVLTAAMYLSAEELGRKHLGMIPKILSSCTIYSVICGGVVSAALYGGAPLLAEHWINDLRTVGALRLFALVLPLECICGVLRGYFAASERIGTLAAVGIGEQLCSMAVTMAVLTAWAGSDPARACQAIILGSGAGTCLALVSLGVLCPHTDRGQPVPQRGVVRRLLRIAVPLALADDLKAGLSAAEKLVIPKRLMLHTGTEAPMAAFGVVCGMVLPVLMLPAAILFALAELLIPELARCAAVGSTRRIRYLTRRSLRMAMLYGLCCGGLLFLLAAPLGETLYHSEEAGRYLMLFALLSPMLYCDALIDAMTKGLGQQTYCVRYNIITSALDLLLLYILLPRYGMYGYFLSFFATHLLNFALSIRRLLIAAQISVSFYRPALAGLSTLLSIWVAAQFPVGLPRTALFLGMSWGLYWAFGALRREDLQWARGLMKIRRP